MSREITTDVLVVGSGAAGLCAAIAAREGNAETVIASIAAPGAGNATAVSGGIMNAAVAEDDSREIHFEDSIRSGQFINDRPLISRVIEMMPGYLSRLEKCGVAFYQENGRYQLVRSPGHTRARTLMFRPRLGTSLSKPLAESAIRLGAKAMPSFNLIKVLVRDGRAVGALGYDWEADEIVHVAAKVVVLATGGASLLYSRTRIPPGVPGDGYGIALHAGLTLQDMEFVQFYPTILAEPGMAKMLIGYEYFIRAGAVLRNALGEDIVARHGLPEPEMITRDQLSIAIAREVYEGRGVDGAVLLDATGIKSEMRGYLYDRSRFGQMVRDRELRGEDLLSRPIRVAPANHYFMGGAQAGTSGETAVEGLLICGELAGGTHGANRLQGNSLSETVVMGFEVGRKAAEVASHTPTAEAPEAMIAQVRAEVSAALGRESGTPIREVVKELQSAMTARAAIIREGQGLLSVKGSLDALRREIPRCFATTPREKAQLCTISQLLDTAECVVLSALARTESRGAQYRLDFPQRDDGAWTKHITCTRRDGEITTSTCPVKIN